MPIKMPIMMQANEEKSMSFDEYEKHLIEEKTSQMVAIEFYKTLVEHFGWDYGIKSGWSSTPTLVVSINNKQTEFSFGNVKLRVNCSRHIYVITVDDKYIDAVDKILGVFDYIEDDKPEG